MRPCGHRDHVAHCGVCTRYFTDPAYHRLLGGTDLPEPPAVVTPTVVAAVQDPGFWEKRRLFNLAYQRWVAAGKPLTPANELARRRAACNACEHRDLATDACRRCGCPLIDVGLLVSLVSDAPGTLLMATEQCPDVDAEGNPAPRWLAVV